MGRRVIAGSIIFSILILNCCNPKITQTNIRNNSLNSNEPNLRMPFRAGDIVLCAQGNLSPEGFSHGSDRINCSFSVDFLNPTIEDMEIVAAADGEIADIFTTALPGKDLFEGGWGWGNYVVIGHDNGYYTLYAHFDKVLVTIGQSVKSGVTLGTIGKTGLAGGIDHLHFGLFQGSFKKHEGSSPPLLPMQIPIEYLLTLDLDKNENGFVYHRGIDIVGIPLLFGNIYVSENDDNRKPQSGNLPKSTLDSLILKRKSLITYLKTDPFAIMKIKGDKNVQIQIDLIKNKIKTIH
jgi:hypothetical protein